MHVRARALALPCPALVNEFDFIHLFSICGDALNETQRHASSRRTSLAHVVAFSWQVQCEGTPANESPPCGEQTQALYRDRVCVHASIHPKEMKVFSIAALSTLSIASVWAGMDCEKTSRPMSLQYTEIGWGTRYSNHTGLAKKGSDSHAFLRIQDGASREQFEFFECKSPPEGFETSPADAKYGQIRSAKDHSLCLTVQGIDNRPVYDYNHKAKGTKREYDRKNGYLTLEACSSHPRRQWWSDSISYVGMKKDQKRNHCSVDDDGKLFMYRNHAPSMMPHGGDSLGGFLTWESKEE